MCSPHKNRIYVILFIEVGILLLVKVLTSVFPFLYGMTCRFCVVANRSRAFFGVCDFGCTHFFIRGENVMKKMLALITIVIMVISLSACSSLGVDKEAINNAITRIEANELGSAISVINQMDDKTLSAGKSEILSAIIGEINTYLNYNSWVSTDYHFIDERAIKDIEKYQTIVNILPLADDESNVDDFISKALSLKKYAKWNDYHSTDAAGDFTNIKNTMDQGEVYKSNPSIASRYYKQAYNDCMTAYNSCINYSGYGMKEAADFYYNFAVQTNSIITQSGTTSSQDNAYNAASSAFQRIQQEHIDDLDDVIDICDGFPKNLY